MDKSRHCQLLLEKLTEVMQANALWEATPPPPSALQSTQPFAIDCLSCEQWLQWVLIPRLSYLIQVAQPLPQAFEISPYVEEAMKYAKGQQAVLTVTRELDQLFKIN
ncbi:YqcC family protein [Photobacterium sanctipauli]|uniref:YqcC family protein n=1 Tax=Photobacterium sanctipauli TaxID=1342794 RepID=A0A2T3NDY8_9GAMM|nr:YqcC family protein [Photobacterium sanctipauli]PSW12607.1 YqcC family protein [Photobacterium sanctipauli]